MSRRNFDLQHDITDLRDVTSTWISSIAANAVPYDDSWIQPEFDAQSASAASRFNANSIWINSIAQNGGTGSAKSYPAFVQPGQFVAGSTSPLVAPLPSSRTIGNVLVGFYVRTGGTSVSISGGGGNWQQIGALSNNAPMFWCPVDGNESEPTITAANMLFWGSIHEFSVPFTPLGGFASYGTVASLHPTSPIITTTPKSLVLAFVGIVTSVDLSTGVVSWTIASGSFGANGYSLGLYTRQIPFGGFPCGSDFFLSVPAGANRITLLELKTW